MSVDSPKEIRFTITEQQTGYKEDGDTYRCRAAKQVGRLQSGRDGSVCGVGSAIARINYSRV